MENGNKKFYVVSDQNGVMLTNENGVLSTDIAKAKTFEKIGDAMRAAVRINVGANTFSVIPMIKKD